MNAKEIYKCELCGKVIEILTPASPETKCCGQPMTMMKEQNADWKGEKHVPHITIDGNLVTVDVGISMGTPHPMAQDHYIMWIELICPDGCSKRKFLKPGDEPKAVFCTRTGKIDEMSAREYCNKHGLWKA